MYGSLINVRYTIKERTVFFLSNKNSQINTNLSKPNALIPQLLPAFLHYSLLLWLVFPLSFSFIYHYRVHADKDIVHHRVNKCFQPKPTSSFCLWTGNGFRLYPFPSVTVEAAWRPRGDHVETAWRLVPLRTSSLVRSTVLSLLCHHHLQLPSFSLSASEHTQPSPLSYNIKE